MNRAERRRKEKQERKKDPVYNIKQSDIEKIKKDSTNEAADLAFFLMLAIPVMVIHDKFPKLIRREDFGKPRAERFADYCIDLYDSFEKGIVTIEDLQECLWEEANIKLEKKQ